MSFIQAARTALTIIHRNPDARGYCCSPLDSRASDPLWPVSFMALNGSRGLVFFCYRVGSGLSEGTQELDVRCAACSLMHMDC